MGGAPAPSEESRSPAPLGRGRRRIEVRAVVGIGGALLVSLLFAWLVWPAGAARVATTPGPHAREGTEPARRAQASDARPPAPDRRGSARVAATGGADDGAPTAKARLVRGRVIDADGAPVQAAVGCADDDEVLTTGDATGHFTLEAPGCALRARDAELGATPAVDPVASGGDEVEVVLAFAHGAELSGRVVDRAGEPVPGAVVVIAAARSTDGEELQVGRRRAADADGAFRLAGLPPGRFILRASAPHAAAVTAAPVELEAHARQSVVIELGAGGALIGRVTDASGAPIAHARVTLASVLAASDGPAGESDAAGRFRLEPVPAEPFSIRVGAPGHATRIVSGLCTGAHAEGLAGDEARSCPGDGFELDAGTIALAPTGDAEEATEMGGVGLSLHARAGRMIVLGAFEDSPAEAAGVAGGDVLVRVDDVALDALTAEQCGELLRGAPGSTVRLVLERDGVAREVVLARSLLRL